MMQAGYFVFIFAYLAIFLSIIIFIINGTKKSNNVIYDSNNKAKYKDISIDELNKININDLNGFKNYLYDIFVKFEYACNDIDYSMMNLLSTSELYNNYQTGFLVNLKKGHKKIINNIERKNVIIHKVYSSEQKQVVNAIIEIRYNNYTIDKTGNLISGNKFQKCTEKFKVTFNKELNNNEKYKCPNCGSTITSNKCEYCNTIININGFKIDNIKLIKENN